MVWWKVIIVSALSLSLRDKDRFRDRESLTIYNLCLQEQVKRLANHGKVNFDFDGIYCLSADYGVQGVSSGTQL